MMPEHDEGEDQALRQRDRDERDEARNGVLNESP